MKARLITAAIGIPLFLVVMIFFDTMIFNLAITVVSVVGVFEILESTGYLKNNRTLLAVNLFFAATVPYATVSFIKPYYFIVVVLYVMLLFCVQLRHFSTVRIEQIAMSVFVSFFFPFAISTLVYMRDAFGMATGMYYVFLIFGIAWGADGGAYFIGKFFGKRKLAPQISPHKTIAGFVGGFVAGIAFSATITAIYYFIMQCFFNTQVEVNFAVLAGATVLCTLISVMGDLSASIIKRQYNIKDFGKVMPGHGGIMDRFDSVYFVSIVFFLIVCYLPI